MYDKVPQTLSLWTGKRSGEVLGSRAHLLRKSIKMREGCKPYVFYDGPPTANGKPHIGHVETRVIKDMIPRYRAMKGYMVPRKAGWDTHGLPVELEVEKKLGLDGKEQIEQYGLEPFIKECKESVWKYKGMWEDFSNTVGFWADMDNPYVTYDNSFIESEWWALKEIWEKKLLYKGFKIVPYCPRCGTPLSAQEVAQGYKLVKERSAVVRFKAVGEDAYFLAWTTTPWTLPSNVALCVNPDETYCKVAAADGKTYYMAQALLDQVLGKLAEKDGDGNVTKPAYEVLETYKGTDLEYREYEPLFACAGEEAKRQRKKAHYVTCDTYVTMSDGTGIVHIAPAFGEDVISAPPFAPQQPRSELMAVMARAVSNEFLYEQPMTERQPDSMEAAGAAFAMERASSWMVSAGTSVIFSAHSGVYSLACSANSSKPYVFCSTKSWS